MWKVIFRSAETNLFHSLLRKGNMLSSEKVVLTLGVEDSGLGVLMYCPKPGLAWGDL